MSFVRHAACQVLFLAALAFPASAQQEPVTIFVVRHAEKGLAPTDPSLTGAGRDRARLLAHMLVDGNVHALFATQFKRTQETLAPLAEQSGTRVTVLDAGDVATLVTALRELPPGTRAVVAGHSNTAPDIVKRLTGTDVGPLTDADYDRLFVVTLAGGTGSVVVLRYGR